MKFSLNDLFRGVLILAMVLLITLFASKVRADDTVELQNVSLDYKSFKDGSRDPLFYNSNPASELDLHLDLSILDYFFMDNMVHSMTNQYQFYVVGWNYKLGLHLCKYLDVQFEHYSQHILDDRYPYQDFPLENSIGITIHLFEARKRPETLF